MENTTNEKIIENTENSENTEYDIQKTNEFIKIVEKIHVDNEGNPLYSYEKTKYITNILKVEIYCKKHKTYFLQSPKKHKSGQGCTPCGKSRAANLLKSNTKDFIKKAVEAHHDENGLPLFDYDEVEYQGCDVPVIIKCKKEGHRFEQTPTNHYKNGCKFCSGCYKRDTEDFITRSKEIHKDEDGNSLFDYSKVEYKTTEDKVELKCRKGHTFFQTPHHNLAGHGCDYCARGIYILNTEQLIEESRKVHGDKYDYSKSIFTGMNNHITIKCNEHGEFSQVTINHVTYGRGCYDCAQIKNGIAARKPLEKFIEEANIVHNNKFNYSRVHETYEKGTSKVNIGCPICEQYFLIRVKDHLDGHQCKNCKNKTQVILYNFLRNQYGDNCFVPEKIFEECKNKNYLPFDFYSEEMNLVIELDGRQHFQEVNIFRETLEIRQKIDFKKMFFLQNKNISLIRIFQEDIYENKYDWKNDIINNINTHLENLNEFNISYLSKNHNIYNDYKINYEKYLIENIVNNIDTDQEELNEYLLEENDE
jgi:very-short-patch-repair endonuclease